MPWSSSRPPRSGRGYGAEHTRRRNALLAELRRNGVGACVLGGEPIYAEHIALPRAHPRKPVLDHCPCRTGCGSCGGTGYRGLACWHHNSTDGSVRAREKQTVTAIPM